MNELSAGKVILAVGKRNTGKSTLIVDILNQYRPIIPCAVCISGSEDGNGFYKKFIPDIMIYSEYDPEILRRLIKRQRAITKRYQAGENVNPNCLLILDDVAFDKSIFRSREIRRLVYNGRHCHVTLIIAAQFLVDIPPDIRTNIDLIFALRENIRANQERLYKFFFGIFSDFYTFTQALISCTNNFECLVCDNTARSNDISECIYWYKAPLHPPFRFGHPEFWKLAEKHYNTDYSDDDDDMFDSKTSFKPKRPSVNIKKLE